MQFSSKQHKLLDAAMIERQKFFDNAIASSQEPLSAESGGIDAEMEKKWAYEIDAIFNILSEFRNTR